MIIPKTPYKIATVLTTLPRALKSAIVISTDAALLCLCVWAAVGARTGLWWSPVIDNIWWMLIVAPITGVVTFSYLGMYRNIVRYLGDEFYLNALKSVTIHVISLFAVLAIWPVHGIPRSVPVIYWLFAMLAVVSSRIIAARIIRHYSSGQTTRTKNTVIFGAGPHGAELASTLKNSTSNRVIAFIDDKKVSHGRRIRNVRVHPTSELNAIIRQNNVELVLLAIPEASKSRRRNVLDLLDECPVHVKTMPAMGELLSGKATVQDIREIDIEDLLGREPVEPDPSLIRTCIAGKSVMVTGAGGSIGSELCRQIISRVPQTLILVDISEYSLYNIERELRGQIACKRSLRKVEIIALLASVNEAVRLTKIMRHYRVDTVYHAAAYKHVPTVESNAVIAVKNNVFGTKSLAEAAVASKSVSSFIMVSTDKAVRPRSVMGATKNVAEQVIRMLDARAPNTRFAIVRFGNVIGSSGSVVPLFREQISNGGPVTVTDPSIERYFMTIPEAAELVIQAGSMGSGGERYVLDMGQPIKVMDLARRMIRLSGLHIRDSENLGGDIEIEITGLRPGEKLFEEVYESDDIVPTCHPRISKELGSGIDIHKIEMALALLHKSCSDDNATTVRSILKDVVCGYHPYEYYDPTSVREVIQTENIKTQRQSCIPKHA